MDCSVFAPALTSHNYMYTNRTSAEGFSSKLSQFCYSLTNKLLKMSTQAQSISQSQAHEMKQIFLSLLVFGLIFDNFGLNPDST